EDMIFDPNPEVHPGGLPAVLVQAAQGEMILDRKVMVVMRDRLNRPLSFHLLPPDDIKPRYQVLLEHMESVNQMRMGGFRTNRQVTQQDYYQVVESIFDKYGVDVSNAAWVQEVDGVVLGAWSAEECSVDIKFPSDELNQFGYGKSPLERSLEATTLLLLSLNYNKGTFLRNYPEAFLIIEGDYDPVGLEAFKQKIYAEVGPQGNQRLPVLSTGDVGQKANLLKLRDTPREMEMPQMI